METKMVHHDSRPNGVVDQCGPDPADSPTLVGGTYVHT